MLRSLWRLGLGWLLNKSTQHCPCVGCGQTLEPPLELPPHELDGVLACPSCGRRASVLEWARKRDELTTPGENPDGSPAPPMEQPSYSEIQRLESDDGSVVWNIPRGSGGSFLFVFAVLWNLICVGLAVAFIVNEPDKLAGPAIFVFLFPAIGIFLLYWGVRQKFSTHLLGVGPAGVLLERKLFNTRKRINLPPGTVTSVQMKVFYQQNYEPVYGIEIRGTTGKLRFGSALDEDEKLWLCQDIRRVLGLSGEEEIIGTEHASGSDKAAHKVRETKRRLQVTESGGSLEIVTPAGRFEWLLGLIGAIFLAAAVFLFVQAFGSLARLDSGSQEGAGGLLFAILGLLFGIFPLLLGAVFGIAGAAMLAFAFGNRNSRTVLRVTRGGAEWSRVRGGSEKDQRRLSRHEIHDVRVVRCPYEVNHVPSFRGEIIGSEFVLPFGFYCDPVKLRAATRKMRQLLDLPESVPLEDASTS